MLRKLFCASLVLVFCVAITKAEEIRAVITKVDADKGTITYKVAAKKGEVSKDEITVKVDPKATFVKGKFDPDTKKMVDGDAIEKGLKSDVFAKIDEKGLRGVTITTSGTGTDTVATKVMVGGAGKRMKQE